jgi:hypothetical protein
LLAQRVSRRWNNAINTSPALGKKLYLRKGLPEEISWDRVPKAQIRTYSPHQQFHPVLQYTDSKSAQGLNEKALLDFGIGWDGNTWCYSAWWNKETHTIIKDVTINPFFNLLFRPTFSHQAYLELEKGEKDFVKLRYRAPPPRKPDDPSPSYNRMNLAWPPIKYLHIVHYSLDDPAYDCALGDDSPTGTGLGIFGRLLDQVCERVRRDHIYFENYADERELGHNVAGLHTLRGLESCQKCEKMRVDCGCE